MFRAKDLEFKIWIAPSRFLFEQPVCDHIFGGFPENKKQQQKNQKNPPPKKKTQKLALKTQTRPPKANSFHQASQ